jgi:hypothetical protein
MMSQEMQVNLAAHLYPYLYIYQYPLKLNQLIQKKVRIQKNLFITHITKQTGTDKAFNGGGGCTIQETKL